MRPAYLRGLGLWTPGFPGPDAWCRAEPDEAVAAPEAALLAGPHRRRASALTRMAADALAQALAQAGRDPATLPSVWATVHGEHETAIEILAMMNRGEGRVSPTRFHNSVYNTASGYASIATGNRCNSTTLTGDGELVATALLEALCMLGSGSGDVALVLFDEPLRPPFDPRDARAPLALAFCLSAHPEGALALLSGLRREPVGRTKRHALFGGLTVSAGLPLLEHALRRRPGTVALELEGQGAGPSWCIDVELVG
ncbi:MAG: beta-ketoacyl synthase chain length factor [Myxococcota bacterium]|nr:beta-ketoacyl synthase chain length factor [Myxococcota bacterium]